MNAIANFFDRLAQTFRTETEDVMTGAEAVVTDYTERQELSLEGKEIEAEWYDAERLTESGVFNELSVANIKINLGQYGEYSVTLEMEDELEEFMNDLNLSVQDLEWLTDQAAEIPMIRDGGEWRIRWEDLQDYNLYTPEDEHPQLPEGEE